MNVIYLVVSAVCAFFLLTRPFIDLTLGYNVSPQTFQEIIGNSLGENVDARDIVGADGITLNMKLSLTSQMCIDSATKPDTYEYVKTTVLDENVAQIAESVKTPLANLNKESVLIATKLKVKALILKDIATTLPGEDANTVAADAGITDTYISNFSKEFFTKLQDEETDFATDMAVFYDAFEEMYHEKLGASHAEYTTKPVSNATKTELNNEIKEPLVFLGWFDGDTDEFLGEENALCSLLGKILGADSTPSGEEGEPGDTSAEPLLAARLNAEEEEPQEESKFVSMVKSLLYDKIDQFGSNVGLVFKIIGFVHLFVLGAWALLGVFCILKSLFKNPGIFFGFFYWINLIIQLIVGILLVYALPYILMGLGYIPVVGPIVKTFTSSLSLSLVTSMTITAFCSLGIFLTSFIYKHWKRKRKDEI